jgi:calcineurin-like phosphoesterase family protein
MRTLIVSDLHLGSVQRSDVLRSPELREPLLEACSDVDRLVLLGDVFELRHGPLREAIAAARPLFEDLGEALSGRELILVAGNHDHALIEPWLARRGEATEPPALGLEQRLEPADVSPAFERIAGWASQASIGVAYPGLWLRPDVYACHGHYLDCHLTVPTLERLSVGAMSRLLGRPAQAFDSVRDYESISAPVYAWRDAIARDERTGDALNGVATVAAWRALGGAGASDHPRAEGDGLAKRIGVSRSRSLMAAARRRALVAAFPLAVAALNRAGLGPLGSDISGSELRRAGVAAMGEVAARLGLADAYVVFGHTHRAGPLPGDAESEWRGRAGARLVNAGNWTYTPELTTRMRESPYWPGSCVVLEGTGPPRVKRLLQDRTPADMRLLAR